MMSTPPGDIMVCSILMSGLSYQSVNKSHLQITDCLVRLPASVTLSGACLPVVRVLNFGSMHLPQKLAGQSGPGSTDHPSHISTTSMTTRYLVYFISVGQMLSSWANVVTFGGGIGSVSVGGTSSCTFVEDGDTSS